MRAINFFVLSPDLLANPDQVTDADAQARYDSQPAAYRIPAQRQVEQIVFKDQADAEAALMELAGGKSFEDLAKDRGLTPDDYNLGLITKDKIVDPAVADVAFSIPQDSHSDIIAGRFGPVIVKVHGCAGRDRHPLRGLQGRHQAADRGGAGFRRHHTHPRRHRGRPRRWRQSGGRRGEVRPEGDHCPGR